MIFKKKEANNFPKNTVSTASKNNSPIKPRFFLSPYVPCVHSQTSYSSPSPGTHPPHRPQNAAVSKISYVHSTLQQSTFPDAYYYYSTTEFLCYYYHDCCRWTACPCSICPPSIDSDSGCMNARPTACCCSDC